MLCDAHPPQLRQGLPLAPRRLGATSLGAFWHAQSARRGATWAGSPCGSNGEKKQWIVWVDHHFLCQHFLGIHNPYFQRHGCFLMWGCDLQKRGLYRQHGDDYMFSQQKCVQQTSWSWLIQGPTVVMSCCIHQLLHLYECGLLKLVCL